MKWGTAYGADYVNKAYSMVKRNLDKPFDFICFTDDPKGIREEVRIMPLPEIYVPEQYRYSPWRKLSMFEKDLAGLGSQKAIGLFIDLDIVIVDNINCFFEVGKEEDFFIIENWTQLGQGIGNSSIYRFPIGKFSFIHDVFVNDPLKVCQTHRNEQIFLSKLITEKGLKLNYWPEEWCRSFKRHSLSKNLIYNWFNEPIIPKDTKVVVFHGHPKPDEAAKGIWLKKPFWKKFKAASWINKYWYTR
jgi:hypothetical protein